MTSSGVARIPRQNENEGSPAAQVVPLWMVTTGKALWRPTKKVEGEM